MQFISIRERFLSLVLEREDRCVFPERVKMNAKKRKEDRVVSARVDKKYTYLSIHSSIHPSIHP